MTREFAGQDLIVPVSMRPGCSISFCWKFEVACLITRSFVDRSQGYLGAGPDISIRVVEVRGVGCGHTDAFHPTRNQVDTEASLNKLHIPFDLFVSKLFLCHRLLLRVILSP